MKKICILIFAFICINGYAQKWVKNGSNYSITFGDLSILAEAGYGGRISSFKMSGTEFFFTGSGMRGATFWPSPQSMWNYSPFPAVLDSDPYSATLQNNDSVLVLTSGVCPRTNCQVIKTLWANPSEKSISIKYTLINKSGATKSFAPWELTRVPVNGLTFFPKGSGWAVANPPNPAFPPAKEDTIVWVKHQSVEGQKLFRDGGEGWIAHIHDNMIFIKKYPDVLPANFAPVESDIELWSSSGLEEVEVQGGYVSLNNNASFDWTVKWFLRCIPSNVSQSVGSSALVRLARDVSKTGCNCQSIGFNNSIPNKLTGDPDFTVNATSSSGQTVSYRIVSGPATITGNLIHLTGSTGTVVVEAAQQGTTNYCFTQITQSFKVSASPTGDGLTANYYNDDNILANDYTALSGTNYYTPNSSAKFFTHSALTRIDPAINFNWGTGSPGTGVNANYFSVIWEGQIQPLYSETYTFYGTSDDGITVTINNQKIIDIWRAQPQETNQGVITLNANQKYNIKVEFMEVLGPAFVKLEWQSTSQSREVVPQTQLFSKPLSIFDADKNENDANQLVVYPIPVEKSGFYIDLKNELPDNNAKIQIYNLQGQEIYSSKLSGNSKEFIIPPSQIAVGIYMLKYSDDKKMLLKKIIFN